MTLDRAAQAPATLCNLPLELRNRICQYVVGNGRHVSLVQPDSSTQLVWRYHHSPTSLLLVSRQLRDECQAFLDQHDSSLDLTLTWTADDVFHMLQLETATPNNDCSPRVVKYPRLASWPFGWNPPDAVLPGALSPTFRRRLREIIVVPHVLSTMIIPALDQLPSLKRITINHNCMGALSRSKCQQLLSYDDGGVPPGTRLRLYTYLMALNSPPGLKAYLAQHSIRMYEKYTLSIWDEDRHIRYSQDDTRWCQTPAFRFFQVICLDHVVVTCCECDASHLEDEDTVDLRQMVLEVQDFIAEYSHDDAYDGMSHLKDFYRWEDLAQALLNELQREQNVDGGI